MNITPAEPGTEAIDLGTRTSDLRIRALAPLPAPNALLAAMPLGTARSDLVTTSRREVRDVLTGEDDRLLTIVGPCSVHDPVAALDYASRLATIRRELSDDLVVVMRVYFEKPRTTTGWKGLINDPHLDGSGDVNAGLRIARRLLLEILDLGLPIACEWLDPITPQYIADTVAWGAIGARTTESQTHRQLASGLSMPIGFKNGTDGDVKIAVDAVRAAAAPHTFAGIEMNGTPAVLNTTGNPDCHVILRGGRGGPNYDAASVGAAVEALRAAGLPERIVVDTSHDNSGKDDARQPLVAADLAQQIAAGNRALVGVMMESFLVAGNQKLGGELTYGQSITDKCMDWATTVDVLGRLAEAVQARRDAV